MSFRIYPEKLKEYILSEESNIDYIPRHIKFNEHLRLYRRYFVTCFGDDCIKVDEIYDVEGVEYYFVKYPNSLYGTISFPLDNNYTYELLIDKKDIKNIDNIINTKVSYTGAEIKYWFFIHNIDLSSEKYIGFWSFLNPNSKNVISDDKYYFVKSIKEENGIYIDCRISLDKSKEQRIKSR